MATTSRKSASKKTKTVRKVSAATTRKTTTKKVTPKKKTTKAAAAKTTSASKAQKPVATTRRAGNEAMEVLRSLNFFVAFASAVQAGLILWLSKAFGGIRSVNAGFTTNDSLASAANGHAQVVSATHRLFDVHLSWMIAAFLIVTAVVHLALATVMRNRYEREVGARVNRMRWVNYAVSGSLVLVTIALAASISDLVTLLAIAGFTVIASLVALSREHYTQNGERTRLVYSIGAIAAAAPLVVFLLNILGNHQYGVGGTPKYMYWIYFTALVLMTALAKNLIEQTRGRGRWTDYVYAEKVYIWLSLVGNGAIAWQIYAALLKK